MSKQLDLFERYREPLVARESDPPTSKESAAEIKPKLSAIKTKLVQMAGITGDAEFTAREIAEAVKAVFPETEAETLRKRVRELVNDGEFVETAARPCRFTGKPAMAFRKELK